MIISRFSNNPQVVTQYFYRYNRIMKILRYLAVALLLATTATSAVAQDKSTSSIVRKRNAKDKDGDKASQITPRMRSFYEQQETSDADVQWMKVIYRQIDLRKEQNMALYYPEEPNQDGMNLFCIIMKLVAQGQLTVYEYLDGREIFTDQYKVKVRDLLDRFHILYTEAKGSTEKTPRFTIEDADMPSNEVLSYYVIEKWEFDRVSTKMKNTVQAICPVLHRSDEFGGEPVRYPMFWVKYDESIRPYLAKQYIFTNNDNNIASHNIDDFFTMNLYKGDIYKTKNLRNLSLMQMYPDPDDLKRAQDSIERRLQAFDKTLWVPTREELQARADSLEALEAARIASDTTLVISRRDEKKSTTKRSSTRSSKRSKAKTEKKEKATKPKESKVKEQKVKSSSSAARSVRRRR